jgi:hypothetical protein
MCWRLASIGERPRWRITAIWLGAIKNGDRFPIGRVNRRFDSFVRAGVKVAMISGVLRSVELGENCDRSCRGSAMKSQAIKHNSPATEGRSISVISRDERQGRSDPEEFWSLSSTVGEQGPSARHWPYMAAAQAIVRGGKSTQSGVR